MAGAIMVSGIYHLPVQVWGYNTGLNSIGRRRAIRPVPFLVGGTYLYNNATYTYDPYEGYTESPPADLQTLRPNGSDIFVDRYKGFLDATGTFKLFPATFQFYTPVKVDSVSVEPSNGDKSLILKDEDDAFSLSMTVTEYTKFNTLYPMVSAEVSVT